MRFINTFPLTFGLTAAFDSSMTSALPSDRKQPIRAQANSTELNDEQGVAAYRGDVVVAQGSIKLTGNTAALKQDKNGNIEVMTSVGKPIYYGQKSAPDKDVTKAYDLIIRYFVAQNRVVLVDQAKMIQEGNTFEDEKTVYSAQRQVVNTGHATGSQVTSSHPCIDMVVQSKERAQ